MSKWIEITNADDVSTSDDGKDIDVLYGFDRDGNKYISIPVEFIPELTRLQAIEKAAREWAEEPENEWFDGLCKCGACTLHRALNKKTPA